MIIYRCIISGDEMFSDAFKVKEGDFFYEVEGRSVTRTEDFDDTLIGANASAEEAAEGNDSSSVSGIDIILNHKLQETGFDKKQYMTYIKEYMKAIKAKLEENNPGRVEAFTEGAKSEVKKIVANIKNYQFFTGESMNPEGMVGLLDFREDGITPFMLFFKDGLEVEKCVSALSLETCHEASWRTCWSSHPHPVKAWRAMKPMKNVRCNHSARRHFKTKYMAQAQNNNFLLM
uniref:Translationally-controlled tumor protein homolog n=2 Tax=Echeneis naucrates TaxID=173247 RepID=A0A665UM18_ECHNA